MCGFVVAFGVPFVFAEVIGLTRDLYYAVYMASVAGLVATWARASELNVRALVRRRWRPALVLGLVCGGLLSFMVVRTESGTPRPGGLELAAALVWRGVLYGATDGILLSVFPILAVFAAFEGRHVLRRLRGKASAPTAAFQIGRASCRERV